MNQFEACKILGLKGNVTPRHVVFAYTRLSQNPFISCDRLKKVNVAFSVLRNFNGYIFNKPGKLHKISVKYI